MLLHPRLIVGNPEGWAVYTFGSSPSADRWRC
jgi:hypothetical protein